MSRSLVALSVLARLRLKLLFRRNLTRYTRAARLSAPLRLLIPVLVVLVAMSWMVGPLSLGLRTLLRGSAGPHSLLPILSWTSTGLAAFVFFYSTVSLVGTFTGRNDLSLLLLTPLSPRLIVGQKLLSVSGTFSLLFIVLGAPILAGTGSVLHARPVYLPFVTSMLLLLPVCPTSLALLLLLPVLRFVPPARARTWAAVLGGAVGGAVYLGGQLLVADAAGDSLRLLHAPTWLVFVPFAWPGTGIGEAAVGVWGEATRYLVATAAVTLPVTGIAIELTSRLFARGWATYREMPRRAEVRWRPQTPTRLPALAASSVSNPKRSVYWPLMHKDWLTLRRDPQRLVQLVFPLLIAAFSLGRWFAGGVGALARLEVGWLFTVLGITSVLLLCNLGLTIVSREGRALYLLALAPVSPRQILVSKWAVCVLPVVVLTETLLLAGAALFGVPVTALAIGSPALFALIASSAAGFICLSLLWPRLDAEGGRQQVSMFALVIGMVMGIVLSLIVVGLLLLALALEEQQPELATAAYLGIFLITGSIAALAYFVGPALLRRVMEPDRALPG